MIYKDLDTPSLLVDLDVLTKNIVEMQNLVNGTGISLRPHTKTHKCPAIAKMQLDHGAKGISVAKLGEAEVMIENGIRDIFIAYPIYGEIKKRRLINVLKKANIIISLDSYEVAHFLSKVGEEIGNEVSILFEINTGLNRCGVEPTDESVKLAKKISELPGISFKGLMGFSGSAYTLKGKDVMKKLVVEQYKMLVDFKKKLQSAGIPVEIISTGSTPTVEFERDLSEITELRPGGYIFNDRTQLTLGRVGKDRCAATVLATVVSVPAPDRAIIDSGSKALCADILFGDVSKGFGIIKGRPDILIERLNEEHGILKSKNSVIKLNIGDRLEIIPNHICVVVNNFDRMYVTQNSRCIKEFDISARGKIQ